MTQADFIAACFWPIVIVLTCLLFTVRNPKMWRLLARATACVAVLYSLLWMLYGESSLLAVIDGYILGVVGGIAVLWTGLRALSGRPTYMTSKKMMFGSIILAAVIVAWCSYSLFGDFSSSRLVLEGRVQRVWSDGRGSRNHYATIAGQKVRATTPVHERLKLLPIVRVEVGRGSNYIYEIEYLAN